MTRTSSANRALSWLKTAPLLTLLAVNGCACGGEPAEPCSVAENTDGSATITCPDSEVTIDPPADGATGDDGIAGADGPDGPAGIDGEAGDSCTVADNMDGSRTITCDDGTSVIIGEGQDGLNAGDLRGLVVMADTDAPANTTHFVAGDAITANISLWDELGYPIDLDDMSRLRMYMFGPLDQAQTVAAVALIGAQTDRAVRPHHYIDLQDDTNTSITVDGNNVTFVTNAITTEAAGTYQIALYSESSESSLTRIIERVNLQIGTATEYTPIAGNCASCHVGANNGVQYLHHVDSGNAAIDRDAPDGCKMCHNQDGYAAFRKCDDGSVPRRVGSMRICDDSTEDWSYVPDAIMLRVHGVHNGTNLASDFGQANFGDYTGVHFPAEVKNCTTCHLTDAWKTSPNGGGSATRQACGSCHDRVVWTTGVLDPPRLGDDCAQASDCFGELGTSAICNTGLKCELNVHVGGSQTTDNDCKTCHTADDSGMSPIPTVHEVPGPTFAYDVVLTMSDPGVDGYYSAGDSPAITVRVNQAGTTTAVDPATITDRNHGRAYLYVSGPREGTVPVLSTFAVQGVDSVRASVGENGPFDLSTLVTGLILEIDGGATFTVAIGDLTAVDISDVTPAEIVAWLNGNATFAAAATASVTGVGSDRGFAMKSKTKGVGSSINVLVSDGQDALGLNAGLTEAKILDYYLENDFRVRTDPLDEDPAVTRSATDFTYQLADVDGLASGTYTVFVELGAAPPMSWAKFNFQVGTANEQDYVATNCIDCHGDTTMHTGFFAIPFDTDMCKSCHDYDRQILGPEGAIDAGRNYGFGAAPLSRRVHGVHRGAYLDYPEQVYTTVDDGEVVFPFSDVVFPQDIRNCHKCHSDSERYEEAPSRLACTGCHDSDAANAHSALQTIDPTPEHPYSGDETETCLTCHGPGRQFSVHVVHNITDPFVPPYER